MKESPVSTNIALWEFISILLLILLFIPGAMRAQGTFSGIGSRIDEQLEQKAINGIELSGDLSTGRRLDIQSRSAALGLGSVDDNAADKILTVFFDDLEKLEEDRLTLIKTLRGHSLFQSLGHSFLHSLFDGAALDPSTGETEPGFDSEFIKSCAAANDMTSLRHWETFRNHLLEEELPLIDSKLIEHLTIKMPGNFERDYPIYRETVEAILFPLTTFDRSVPIRISKLQAKRGEQFFATYSDRISSLTKSDFEARQRVKAILESDTLRNEIAAILLNPLAETGAPAPAPVTNSSLPTVPCRIISIPLPGVDITYSSIETAKREDITDFVKLSQGMKGNFLMAIRANGQPVAFLPDKKLEPPIRLPAIAAEQNLYEGRKLIWLDTSGQLHTLDGPIPGLSHIESFKLLDNYLFAISTDGTRQLKGPQASHPNVKLACADLQNVVSIQGPYVDYIDIVTRHGEFFRATKSEKQTPCPEPAARLLSHDLALSRENQLIQRETGTQGLGDSFSGLYPSVVPNTAYVRNGIAIIGDGTDYYFLQSVDSTRWDISRNWQEALENAVEVQIHQSQYIHALIPADKIPRSGQWSVEDLIAHNKTLP